jgi:DNA-binding CsgD family transcriptional regulator
MKTQKTAYSKKVDNKIHWAKSYLTMISDEQLFSLVYTLPLPANVRIVSTGKYIVANQLHAIQHGFTHVSESTDITYQEMYHHRCQKLAELEGSLILEEQHKQLIEELNARANQSDEVLSTEICTLFPTGFVHKGTLNKVPILGHHKQVICVLTFFEDKTDQVDLLLLYKLYKKHYPIQKAITQFIKYLKLEKYFKKKPTNRELIIILAMRNNAVSKYVAKILGINYRTVEEYKARLRNKLTFGTLNNLLVFLRSRQQKTSWDYNHTHHNLVLHTHL